MLPNRSRRMLHLLVVFVVLAAAAVGVVRPAMSDASPTLLVGAGGGSVVASNGGVTSLRLPVTLSQSPTAPVTVDYSVTGGTAVAGRDFTPVSGTLTLETVESFVVVPVLPAAGGAGGTVLLELSKPVGATLSGNGVGTSTIIEPTGSGFTVSIGDASVDAGISGPNRALVFTVSASAPVGDETTVQYSVRTDTALPGVDYQPTAGTLVLPAGATTGRVTVPVLPDAAPAPNRYLRVVISEPSSGAVARAAGLGVLLSESEGVADPVDPTFASATLTADRHPSTPAAFDTYAIAATGNGARVSTPSTNELNNTRLVYWPSSELPSTDQQTCATWASQDPSNGLSLDDQQGIALRVLTVGGVTRGITVTKNVMFGFNWVFNVHVWDSSASNAFFPIGQFDLARALTVHSHLGPLPWDICAEVVGNVLSFKVWLDGEPPPRYGDPAHGGSVRVPAAFTGPGEAGWYAGHVPAGGQMTFGNLSVEPPTHMTVPSAPGEVAATPADGSATVSWQPARSDGSTITDYTVTATDLTEPGNGGQIVSGAVSPLAVGGLTNGDAYAFTVTATNFDGTGPRSAPSNPVVPDS